jgi:hypothetical protein
MVQQKIATLLILLSFVSIRALAGPPAICTKAASSGNGNYLVITQTEFEPSASSIARKARRVTLEIVVSEVIVYGKNTIPGPGTRWLDTVEWSVILNSHHMRPLSACPLVLITNDGEFLVLVGKTTDSWALQVYRRRDHPGEPAKKGRDHGVFIKAIPLKDLWPRDEFDEWENAIHTDQSPEWFAQGTFSFSPDSRQLIYKTQWSTVARIDLASGGVSTN